MYRIAKIFGDTASVLSNERVPKIARVVVCHFSEISRNYMMSGSCEFFAYVTRVTRSLKQIVSRRLRLRLSAQRGDDCVPLTAMLGHSKA